MCYEAIAAAVSGLNIGRSSGVIIQRFAQLPNVVFEDRVADESIRPDGIEDFLLAD